MYVCGAAGSGCPVSDTRHDMCGLEVWVVDYRAAMRVGAGGHVRGSWSTVICVCYHAVTLLMGRSSG